MGASGGEGSEFIRRSIFNRYPTNGEIIKKQILKSNFQGRIKNIKENALLLPLNYSTSQKYYCTTIYS